MDEQARVSVSIHEGKLEISGSEAFVKEQLDRFEDLIKGRLRAAPARPVEPASAVEPSTTSVSSALTSAGDGDVNPYPNVIAYEGDEVRVLCSLPGSNKAEKALNAALLVMCAFKLKGIDVVPFKAIREVCEHHSCLDSSNFAATLREDRQHIIVSGGRQTLTAKLTHPGIEKAKSLISELNA